MQHPLCIQWRTSCLPEWMSDLFKCLLWHPLLLRCLRLLLALLFNFSITNAPRVSKEMVFHVMCFECEVIFGHWALSQHQSITVVFKYWSKHATLPSLSYYKVLFFLSPWPCLAASYYCGLKGIFNWIEVYYAQIKILFIYHTDLFFRSSGS